MSCSEIAYNSDRQVFHLSSRIIIISLYIDEARFSTLFMYIVELLMPPIEVFFDLKELCYFVVLYYTIEREKK